jgi:hypothetical protein
MPEPARYVDVVEAAAAAAALRPPRNEPLGSTTLDELAGPHAEEVSPPPRALSPDLAWFLPGMLYCVVGLDRSVFHMFSWAAKRDVRVVTHVASSPLVDIPHAGSIEHPWFATLQGVDPAVAGPLVDYVESYRFNDQRRRLSWSVVATTLRIADPFSEEKRGVDVIALLPRCHTRAGGRRIAPASEYNLQLERPRLVVIQERADGSGTTGTAPDV